MLFGKRKGGGMVSFEGEHLISAVEARNAPSSLTGTACGRLRSLLAREGLSLKLPLTQRALFEAPEDAPTESVLWGFVTVIRSNGLMMPSFPSLCRRAP